MRNQRSVLRLSGIAFVASSVMLSAGALHAQGVPHLISGVGLADIEGDVSAVKAVAEANARRALAKAILEDAIGSERASRIAGDVIQSMADQIQPVMIANLEKTYHLEKNRKNVE